MKLSVTSIIPIELYTLKRRKLCEESLLKSKTIFPLDNGLNKIFSEVGGNASSIYGVSPNLSESTAIAFHESSICFCVEKTLDNWELNHSSISKELEQRNKYHNLIINNDSSNPVYALLKEICRSLQEESYGSIQPSYVFSFYILDRTTNTDMINKQELMKLVEPSIIDMDDMLSTECDASNTQTHIKQSAIDRITDIDISNKSETYISWATIVSVVNSNDMKKTQNLLTALECRLQITWNKCYAVSQYVEKVFDGGAKAKNISELYWSFARTLDDAKSVLSSTFSSRADRIFKEMIDTSKIESEITRLEQKISLLEKYINQRNSIQGKKYQKTIELLLFITALTSLIGIFFPVPISIFNENIEISIIILVGFVGIIAIFKSK